MSRQSPAIELRKMIFGYLVTQMVAAVAKLGLPDRLTEKPKRAEELAKEVGAHHSSFSRFMAACASLGLFAAGEDGHYEATDVGRWLGAQRPTLRDLAVAQAAPGHWQSIERLLDAVMTGEPAPEKALGADIWTYYENNPQERTVFASAMSNISAEVAGEVANAYDLSEARLIVDVGGGQGVLLEGLLNAAPDARGILLDLPGVVQEARNRLENLPASGRIDLVAGNFFEQVPHGGDLYVLKTIIHDWDDEKSIQILSNCRKAAQADGKLLLVERVTDVEPDPTDALADMLMMVVLGGKERTKREFEDLLGRSGWELIRVIPLSMHKLLEAKPR